MTRPELRDALALLARGETAAAWEICAPLLATPPEDVDGLQTLGVIALRANKPEQAVAIFKRATELDPRIARLHLNLGTARQRLGRWEEALASYERAIALKPSLVDAHINRGAALAEAGRLEAAIAAYDQALAVQPGHAGAMLDRAIVLRRLGRVVEAIAGFDAVVALEPESVRALVARASALREMNRLNDALASFDRALALRPDLLPALRGTAAVLVAQRRFAEALAAYDRIVARAPEDAEAHASRGEALLHLGRLDEALASFDRALVLKPDFAFLAGLRLHVRMRMCDWRRFDDDLTVLCDAVRRGAKVSPPLLFLTLSDDPLLQRRCAEAWVAGRDLAPASLPGLEPPTRGGRIRLGYFSTDLCNHPVGHLIGECLERHDRARFELTAFAFGPDTGDDVQRRLRAAVDHWIDVRALGDSDVAQLARARGIDIAVDLNGFTLGARPRIFGYRPAPVQVAYLGYAGTSAMPGMDYLLADTTVIPDAERRHFSEKVVLLPHSYYVTPSARPEPAAVTRDACGLPESGFVFCCFNNTHKITPDVFAAWMRILGRVDGGVLWLLEDNPFMAANLRAAAAQHGVAPERLVFAPRTSLETHAARHRLADLFLDTAPYNAHTTATDALWFGLPVVTCPGASFASRVAASLLHAIDMAELIAPTRAAYEALAVSLATEPARLAAVRERLRRNRATTPLFDCARFTRHLEAAYGAMMERARAGLPPDHIVVPAEP